MSSSFKYLLGIYPKFYNFRVSGHKLSPDILEQDKFVIFNLKEITMSNLSTLIFIALDAISRLVEVFGDWCDGASFLFKGHRLKIENSYIDIFPFPCYVYRDNFILHVPYMRDIPAMLFAGILRGLGYNVYSILDEYVSFDNYRFTKVTDGLKV